MRPAPVAYLPRRRRLPITVITGGAALIAWRLGVAGGQPDDRDNHEDRRRAGHCRLALSLAASTGAGSDCPDFAPVLYDAWRRVPDRRFKVAADSGFDSEPNHRRARKPHRPRR